MEERFKKLFETEEDLYTDGSPIILEKGVLLLDTKSNKLLIQMKFGNISEKPFKALYISFNTYDTSDVQMSPVEYKYLDLNVDYGRSFGADKAIILENSIIRSFKVNKYSVVYEDNEIKTFSPPFSQLPDSDFLQNKFTNEELIKQYCIETSRYSKYVPIQYGNIWKCSCGKWNSKYVCWNCKVLKKDIFGKISDPELTANKEKRLEQEAFDKEIQEAQRIKDQKAEQIKRKRMRNIAIAGCVLVVGGILYSSFVQPYITYQHGKKLLSEKKYDDSIAEFAKVEGYKDAQSLIDDAYCQKGESLLKEKKFDEAEEIFSTLDNYKMTQEAKRQGGLYLLEQKEYDAASEIFEELDDSEMCREVDYQRALDYVSQKEYDKAKPLLKQLKNYDYKDSKEQYNSLLYQMGMKNMNEKNYNLASDIFQNIKDYKDALSKWSECQYLIGMKKVSQKKYDEAIECFNRIIERDSTSENAQNAKEQIKECYYQNGLKLMEEGEYQQAAEAFSNIKDYKDSKDKMQFSEDTYKRKKVETLFPMIKFGVSPKKIEKEFGKPDNTSTIDKTQYREEQYVYSYKKYCEISGIPGTLDFKFERRKDNKWRLVRVEWNISSQALTPEAYELILKYLENSWGYSTNKYIEEEYWNYNYNTATNELENSYSRSVVWKEKNYGVDYDRLEVGGSIKSASICVYAVAL